MNKTILIGIIAAFGITGISTAYAINLDLKADTTVTGDLGVTGTISGIGTVPIGTVLDWWCSSDCTIPDGFAIADGSTVSDPESPFDGDALPDLTDTFIRGTTNVNDVGQTGGSQMHSHPITDPGHGHPAAGIHSHQIGNSGDHGHNISSSSHGHTTGGPSATMPGGAIGFGTFPSLSHTHTAFALGGIHNHDTEGVSLHSHPIQNSVDHSHPAASTSITVDGNNNEPPYFVLVKIIRIK